MSVLKSINYIVRASRLQLFKQNGSQIDVFRGLYSASSLGIDSFIQQQDRIRGQLANIQEKFKLKMKENTEETSKNIIFTEDLKNMIHIAVEEDIDIVIKMMKKFNKQNKELRFGNFIFGSVVMRMFSVLNKPNEALECFKSPELKGFFDQLMTYQILCDLLYENQKYQDILDCLSHIKDRQIEGAKYPRNIIVLVFASCYKMNTQESLNYAINLWKELLEVGHVPARRTSTFFSGLLLKNDRADLSLEVLSNVKNQNYTTVRNLKVLTLTKLNRLEDTIPILKSVLQQEQLQTFNKDVLDVLQESIQKSDNTELLNEFNHIMKIFQEQKNISDTSLEQQLCSEITSPRFNQFARNQNRFQSNRPWRPQQQRYERATIHEME